MSTMKTNKKTLTAGISAAGLLGLGLYLAVPAAADDPTPRPSASGKPHPGHGGKHTSSHGARGGIGIHGEATVQRKEGFRLATWQRGTLTGRSGTTLTFRSLDGATWTWTTDSKTRVRKDGEKATIADLKNGDPALVYGERSGDTRTAKLVRVPKKH
ncbi:hypothetical protein [Actinomadura macra]|uniref:hypothetical protein n=1 Tax=Actinomadura macra TaxID=46164 RepID=UPI00082F01FE|nr:hypothetical protein [Actinomadura macra]